MANEEVLNSDLLRARIMELEYGEVTIEEVKRIYIEETGKAPPGNITIYRSDDFKEELRKGDHYSGFDGTVIHFYDEQQGIQNSSGIAFWTAKYLHCKNGYTMQQ
ncbi:hypothetical protein SAMN05421736_12420 [Evansella caseinilytica]|uniref:DUF6792 domain-containing protein n=1 Tax=Evansella caseinilytica TaxID=1503961 RepID=A0A1H3UP62_9BACI|nr:DUF6792 domain-containing protein [Evansella caseinilytica]SDZ64242.1 hypothetical protein SAMN05421736_12420 [Evansella caseinilytica]